MSEHDELEFNIYPSQWEIFDWALANSMLDQPTTIEGKPARIIKAIPQDDGSIRLTVQLEQ